MPVLVDTSCWIEFLRKKGNTEIQNKVHEILSEGMACISEPILLELWNGVGSEDERKKIKFIQDRIPLLPCNASVYQAGYNLADKMRASGITAPAIDILIFAVSQEYNVDILSLDKHFLKLQKYGKK